MCTQPIQQRTWITLHNARTRRNIRTHLAERVRASRDCYVVGRSQLYKNVCFIAYKIYRYGKVLENMLHIFQIQINIELYACMHGCVGFENSSPKCR